MRLAGRAAAAKSESVNLTCCKRREISIAYSFAHILMRLAGRAAAAKSESVNLTCCKRRQISIAYSFAHFLMRRTGRAAAALPVISRAYALSHLIALFLCGGWRPLRQRSSQLTPRIIEKDFLVHKFSFLCTANITSQSETTAIFLLIGKVIPHTSKKPSA